MLEALPLRIDEGNALAGEGTLAAALAVNTWAGVQCEHGWIRADDWHEHTHAADIRTHDILWIERNPTTSTTACCSFRDA